MIRFLSRYRWSAAAVVVSPFGGGLLGAELGWWGIPVGMVGGILAGHLGARADINRRRRAEREQILARLDRMHPWRQS